MLSTNASFASLHADAPSPQTPRFGKSKFRTLVGIGRARSPPPNTLSFDDDGDDHPVLITTHAVHALPSSTNLPSPSPRSSLEVEEMKIDLSVAHPYANGGKRTGVKRSSSRPNFRIPGVGGQWVAWTVSVAEIPGDDKVYNVYIKTPTHNYTLTRTQKELIELHSKLRDSYPNATLPPFPITLSANLGGASPGTGKRRSSFLHTLSRLTNNSSSRRPGSSGGGSQPPPSSFSGTYFPASPSDTDPFAPSELGEQPSVSPSPNVTPTGAVTPNPNPPLLASYLTTISNDPKLRTARAWKRFIRIRSEDLESVRVERAIKRVRSDVAIGGQSIGGAGASLMSFGGMGLSPEGGFQSEQEDEVGERHERDPVDGEKEKDKRSSVQDKRLSAQDKRLSAVMAYGGIPSAFSSDSDSAHHHHHHGAIVDKEPGTPTPGTPDLGQDGSVPPSEPSEIELPPSPIIHTHPSLPTPPKPKRIVKKVGVEDFEMMRVLGKGCAGKVLLVKYKRSGDLYALKAITKRHVLAHQELQHTLTEQAVLKRMSRESKDPFVVKLWWSFHDRDNLFLVMDFHPGGDLATQLARWGRLGRDRARFYAAEIVEGVDGLHAAGVIYRDLKPENILIGSDGHIVLTDFGLSKEFPRKSHQNAGGAEGDFYVSAPGTPTGAHPHWVGDDPSVGGGARDVTSTFCGTAEYLAPEVIQGLPYSYEVDWWSFGTMLYEMLSGITPFWANNHSDMYVRVLQDELQFPDDRAMDQDTKSLIRGLLQRNPALRMSEPRIKRHPYFSMIDWDHVYYKRYIPPYIPPIDPSNAFDTQNFDETFLEMNPVLDNDEPVSESEREKTEDEGDDEAKLEVASVAAAEDVNATPNETTVDVFDGYSFKGRHSVLIEDEDDEGDADVEGDDEELSQAKQITDALAARHRDGDISDSGTAERVKDMEGDVTPGDSTPGESAITASISTESESVQAPRASKQDSAISDGTLPSLTTNLTTPSANNSAPTTPLDLSLIQAAAAARAVEEGDMLDDPVYAPLPLSPVIETTGDIGEDETIISGAPKTASPMANRRSLEPPPSQPRTREDDEWDLIETPHGEERNGTKGLSFWQRGVVDRYRLAVASRKSTGQSSSRVTRSTSGGTFESNGYGDPPSPADVKQRRGRTGGISLRKSTREFLRAKSPGGGLSASSAASRTSLAAANVPPVPPLSLGAHNQGLLTPSPSAPVTALRNVPSLKSKSSALSKASGGNSPPSSNPSATDLRNGSKSMGDVSTPARSSPRSPLPEPSNVKKMKKYTEQAEKMFSLFSSPKHHQQPQQQ